MKKIERAQAQLAAAVFLGAAVVAGVLAGIVAAVPLLAQSIAEARQAGVDFGSVLVAEWLAASPILALLLLLAVAGSVLRMPPEEAAAGGWRLAGLLLAHAKPIGTCLVVSGVAGLLLLGVSR